jgi:probable HAF family extracellular repeat protein
MQDLGLLPGATFSVAQGVSSDGTVVCGYSDKAAGGPRAFRWTQAGGMQDIGVMLQGSVSQANGIGQAGATIVGSGNTLGAARAFYWTSAGGMQSLGVLPSGVESGAQASGGPGGVAVIGYSDSFFGLQATIWTPAGGLHPVRDLLVQYGVDMNGWTLNNAYGVSSSGLVVAGTGVSQQGQRAWIAKLPVLPCYANCDGSTAAPVLNASDFQCFVNLFMAGDTRANCDGSTAAPTLTIYDFLCFQQRYTAGCP